MTITRVFVYGTLKRGHCRERCWPCRATRVRPSWTRGKLYGRHDYPAMIGGNDRVAGELWEFSAKQIEEVIETLDAIEGTNQPGEVDLYHRVVTEVYDLAGEPLGDAWTYHYASDPAADGFRPLIPAGNELAGWPK